MVTGTLEDKVCPCMKKTVLFIIIKKGVVFKEVDTRIQSNENRSYQTHLIKMAHIISMYFVLSIGYIATHC